MGGRARGANARQLVAFETNYGVSPLTGFVQLPMAGAGSQLGEEKGLIEDDQLGTGREPLDPADDVANNTGNLVVPVDVRAFGYWLKLLFGAPDTDPADAASGGLTFTAQPAVNATVTINSVVWTFKASGATGNQVNIGANLAATMTALAAALNGSADPLLSVATYVATATGITITHDTLGPAGNAFTLAASGTSNATASGATLEGGTNAHVFTTGAQSLPSMSIEHGHPEVPSYSVHFGAMANTLQIDGQRSGNLNATIGIIAQGESDAVATSVDDTPDTLDIVRFAQASGTVKRYGEQVATVRTFSISVGNNLDLDETIRPDGRINGADPAKVSVAVKMVLNFTDRADLKKVGAREPGEVSIGWANDIGSLTFDIPRLFIPKAKKPISGPGAIQREVNGLASGAEGPALTVTLKNDMAGY